MTEQEQKQLVDALARADKAERTLKAVLELVKVNAPELYKAMNIKE